MVLSKEMLECSHHDEFAELIRKMESSVSEYSFANLYLFRRQHDYRVLRHKGFVFLQGVTYDGTRYLMPFSPLKEIGEPVLNELMQEGFCLFPVEEKDLYLFDENKYRLEINRDDSDYVYTRDRIATYPGRKLHKKRNLIKQYRTLYTYEDHLYTCDRANDAMKALDRWFELAGAPLEDTDYIACKEAIEYCKDFGLTGQVYYADGEPSGFLFGEELNDHMFVIHFAKGVITFKGIYEHMYNSLANNLPEKYTMLNFEQDLGKETLRRAKSTYITDTMLDKYRVCII